MRKTSCQYARSENAMAVTTPGFFNAKYVTRVNSQNAQNGRQNEQYYFTARDWGRGSLHFCYEALPLNTLA